MHVTTEDVLDILCHTHKAQTTDGFRLTFKWQIEHETRYTEVFIWESDLNEDHFTTTTVVEGNFDMASITNAVKMLPGCSVVASFEITEGRPYTTTIPRPLSTLLEGAAGFRLHEFWTKDINWTLLNEVIPLMVSEAWIALTSITLDLKTDTLEDQSHFQEIITQGEMRKFLSQLRMLRHLSVSAYSELPEQEVLWFHAPLEHILDTSTTWPYLQSLHLDGIDSSASELLYFLELHSSTLKTLTIRNYYLLSGSWIQALPEIHEFLSLKRAEIAGALEAYNELWLIRIPEFDENCFLAEDLGYWLTHRQIDSAFPLTKENLVSKYNPQEDNWQ
jgi:hypothetical protein